jgi:hypothetical protein
MALAITSSPNTSAHSSNGLFEVIIVELFSYLLEISLKKSEADSFWILR